ncbi:MAG TPA: Sec-independent protein translocase protein TatB [Thiohalobacter sp.]|nr:Sec-independent protein translocase protein TatB [Thiohalobacter sp.]
MFDIGFWELGLLMIIALLVIGPERLPKVARTVGLLLGKARGIVRSVKADVQRELAAEELKQTLSKQAESNPLHEIIEETRSVASDAKSSLDEASQSLRDTGLKDEDRPSPPRSDSGP